MRTKIRIAVSVLTFALASLAASAADRFVSFDKGDMLLCKKGGEVSIVVSDNDNVAVKLAAKNLAKDLNAVADAKVDIKSDDAGNAAKIIVGTIGQSKAIDALVKSGKIDGKALKGKVEKYILTICDGNLVIAGSDRRGTVYGIYELSQQAGVSPWYYWMDVPVKKQEAIYINNGIYTDGEPAVRYRGIFLNDEAPCLTTWVKNTFNTGYGGHEFYEKVFELMLRLKGNYIWPAMWGWAFYADDPLNMKTADDMGVMVGTSHHEPMARSQKEWHGHSDDPNADAQDLKSRQQDTHQWNYATNKDALDRFWRGGVERNKHTEDIITIGMRGDGDMAMSEERNTKLLESVVENQRKIISKVHGKPAKEVPQLWALYKEVQDYYDDGMRVPDDVIMLLCDDNWGNVRRVPNAKECKHPGGWGLYYHVDYVGAPRNSKVLNCTPIQNMWEQLSLAYENGIDKLWILNVGDLKPMEYPIQLFLDLAWKGTDKYT
ncbi:MAG: glycosyl hydrolase 115 family protein, partial [Prevotellaceae bacterium]|nr:glycosyl hydrolase 115 family protein [Prevotellaceae bacterium]